jgi:HSP20 family protein
MKMANLTRFDPFEDAFPDFFKTFARMPRVWRENEMDIRLDVTESEREYKVKAEIPGVKKEDINVAVDGNTVTISAELRKDKEEKNERFVRSERYVGTLSRSFTLGSDVDEKTAAARYVDGVLELVLPKRAGAVARRLAVQ